MALQMDEQFVKDLIEEWGGLEEIKQAVMAIEGYREGGWYESKQRLIDQWEIDHRGLHELVIAIFTCTLTNDYVTYQTAIGMLNHKIKMDDELGKCKIIADVIGLVINTGLIEMTSERGEMHVLTSAYEVDDHIPQKDSKHITITSRPQPVESNWDRDGGTGSVILGHKMNHHDLDVRLSHLNRMNQIPLRIDPEFVAMYEEAPKNIPEDGDQQLAWEFFQEESLNKYNELIQGNNKYYCRHKYDTRGRCYNGSYYLSPQGSSFKKAVVQLYNQELVEGF